MKKLKSLTNDEINSLDGELVQIELDGDPRFVGGFSFILENGDRIYVEPNLDDSSYVEFLKEVRVGKDRKP